MRRLSTRPSAIARLFATAPFKAGLFFLIVGFALLNSTFSSRAATPSVELVALHTATSGSRVRIEVTISRPIETLVEQSVESRRAIIRIAGATSKLDAQYAGADQLVHSVRTRTGLSNGIPWVELVFDVDEGTAITYQKAATTLIIEATRMSYFSSRPAENRTAPLAAKSNREENASSKKTTSSGKRGDKQKKNVKPDEVNPTESKLTTIANPSDQLEPRSVATPKQSAARQPANATQNESKSKGAGAPDQEPKSPGIRVSTQQAGEAKLHGVVTDEMGALIVGASVVLDDGHGHTYSAKTDDFGRYEIDNVVPGSYTLTAQFTGFAVFTQQLEVAFQKIAALDITLRLVISAQVEVRAGPITDLSGTTLMESDIAALPNDPALLMRKLQQMAAMMGIPDAAIFVDGSAGGRMPAKEDIQMIKIRPHSFSAEYAQPTSGRIEVTSRPSGHFHSDLSFKFTDEALNARDPFAPTRAPLQVREYNAYLSGPIIVHKWSFSAFFGRYEQDENTVINAIVLHPITLVSQPFAATLPTPGRNSYYSLGTSYLLRKQHTFRFKYSRSDDDNRNEGVGGFDLPERAYNSSSRTDRIALSAISIFKDNRFNEFYLQFGRTRSTAQALSSAPAVFVLDSFNSGGNQNSLFKRDIRDDFAVSDALTYPIKKHVLKGGFGLSSLSLQDINRGNFGGSFTFGADVERDSSGNPVLDANGHTIPISSLEHYRRTVLGLAGYNPSQFTIVRGNPLVNMSQTDAQWFLQDDWKLSARLLLSYGLRHSFQTNLNDKLNFAPRLGIAWQPFKKRQDTIRAGTGFFYGGIGSDVTFETIRLDGQHQQELTVQRPPFFPDVPGNVNGAATPSTVRIKDPNIETPYSIISMISYTPQLPWKLNGTISVTWERSVHLLRSRNINSPIPGTSGQLPFLNQGPILQFESTGKLARKALDISLSREITSRLSVSGTYTLASSRDDTDGPYSFPANTYNLATEYGRSTDFSRHHFRFSAWASLPWGIELTPYFSLSSGVPFNITTGGDNNGDTIFTDRPSFGVLGQPGVIVTRFGVFNPNPGLGDQIIPRNYGQGPGRIGSGLSVSKSVSFGHGGDESTGSVFNRARRSVRGPYSLNFSAGIENLFNHTNLGRLNGVLTSPFFGLANSSQGARKIKIGAELSFEED